MLVPGIMVVGASVLSWVRPSLSDAHILAAPKTINPCPIHNEWTDAHSHIDCEQVAGKYDLTVLVSVGLGSAVYYAIKTLRDRITKAATVWAERQAQRKRVIGDEESAEWINTVLYRFWQFYEPGTSVWHRSLALVFVCWCGQMPWLVPFAHAYYRTHRLSDARTHAVLCQNIREAVQPQLDANCPGALSGLELGRFTLGKRCFPEHACMPFGRGVWDRKNENGVSPSLSLPEPKLSPSGRE